MKKEIKLCLSEMVEEDASERVDESDKWTTAVDRGGLIHVSDLVYQVFADMELILRMYLKHRPDDVVELSKVKDLPVKMLSLVGRLLALTGVCKWQMI